MVIIEDMNRKEPGFNQVIDLRFKELCGLDSEDVRAKSDEVVVIVKYPKQLEVVMQGIQKASEQGLYECTVEMPSNYKIHPSSNSIKGMTDTLLRILRQKEFMVERIVLHDNSGRMIYKIEW